MQKIAVIGNSCSGKTVFSRQLAEKYKLPLYHVDSVQFLPGMKWRDPDQTRMLLSEISEKNQWIIDGLGPLKIIEDRFQKADRIFMLRPPLWKIFFWCLKRQVRGLFSRRPELPENCFESTPGQTWRLIKTIWNVHRGLWPQLDRIFQAPAYRDKVVSVTNPSQFETY